MEISSNMQTSYFRVNGQSATSSPSLDAQKSQDSKNPEQDQELTPSEKAQITKLQARDTQVRAHEAAHIAAGSGVVTGGASFTYQTGPDNRQYAIGGEVPIDTSSGNTPEETVQKMRQVRAAAMAPADPSPTDYSVAATATILEMRAMQEIAKNSLEESNQPQHSTDAYANNSEESIEPFSMQA
jgi:hypothetical protein